MFHLSSLFELWLCVPLCRALVQCGTWIVSARSISSVKASICWPQRVKHLQSYRQGLMYTQSYVWAQVLDPCYVKRGFDRKSCGALSWYVTLKARILINRVLHVISRVVAVVEVLLWYHCGIKRGRRCCVDVKARSREREWARQSEGEQARETRWEEGERRYQWCKRFSGVIHVWEYVKPTQTHRSYFPASTRAQPGEKPEHMLNAKNCATVVSFESLTLIVR
jgi:hypothetical protein